MIVIFNNFELVIFRWSIYEIYSEVINIVDRCLENFLMEVISFVFVKNYIVKINGLVGGKCFRRVSGFKISWESYGLFFYRGIIYWNIRILLIIIEKKYLGISIIIVFFVLKWFFKNIMK